MKTLFKAFLITGLILALVALALGFSAFNLLSDAPGFHLSIDGEDMMWTGFSLADALGAGLGMIIAVGVMALVIPLVLLLGLGLPLLILGALALAGIAAVVGVSALLGSPLLLIGLVVWLLVRDKPRKRHAPVQP